MNSSYFSLHLLLKTTVICKDLQLRFLEEKKNPAITSSCSKKVIKLVGETAMKGDYKTEKLENIYFGEEANMETR